MIKLGVNIDHVATLRQARGGFEPDPVVAALLCEFAGCDSVVAHLREDRRHINERDVKLLKEFTRTRFNLEMSIAKDIVNIALKIKPHQVTLVPERRQEKTTEGGIDVTSKKKQLKDLTRRFLDAGIVVSLFIDPQKRALEVAREIGVPFIEIHTGLYANATKVSQVKEQLTKIIDMTNYAKSLGLRVNAGHGLNYNNVIAISQVKGIEELNIGHAIISKAVFVGISRAVKEMLSLIGRAE